MTKTERVGARAGGGKPPLAELPAPPRPREGWPWTQDEAESPAVCPAAREWPRITIVTPSFNQGEFLEETIRSVLLQGYPNLEYFVVDGGSTDGSVAILEKYSPWIDWWVSEKDRGQADALNKGFRRATGAIFGYLNSDDLYLPGGLARIAGDAEASSSHQWHTYAVTEFWPDGEGLTRQPPWISADGIRRQRADVTRVVGQGEELIVEHLLAWLLELVHAHQPGTFWLRSQHAEAGGFDSALHFGFDQKFFWGLIARRYTPVFHRGDPVAKFRWHAASKSENAAKDGENRFAAELRDAALEFLGYLDRRSRRVLIREYLDYRLTEIWSAYRRQGSRSSALRNLVRVGLRVPSAPFDRYFRGTLARLLLHPSP